MLLQKKYIADHLSKQSKRNKGELPTYYVADAGHPAIIDRDVFDEVQRIAAERRAKYVPDKHINGKFAFSSKIICAHCGKAYKRIVANGNAGWNCSTYTRKGVGNCYGKKIPEAILFELAQSVLGTATFDAAIFAVKVDHIEVQRPNEVIFHMIGGERIVREWEDRSRRDSWTDAMKAKTRARSASYWEGRRDV